MVSSKLTAEAFRQPAYQTDGGLPTAVLPSHMTVYVYVKPTPGFPPLPHLAH